LAFAKERIGYLLKRPVGRPPNDVRRSHANFTYQAGSWTKSRRVVAKVEWHPGELYPRVGFIVTNMARRAENVVVFYNKRGTCEQWIKEGKDVASRNGRLFLHSLLPTYFVLPIVALCTIALFRKPWSARRLDDEMLFALMLALACVPMLLTPFISRRFVLPVMPFLIIWMAKGIDELSLWSKETLISSLGGESRGSYVQSLVAAVLLLAALVAGAKATRGMEALREARADSLYLKEAGLALRDQAQGKTVMDSGTIVAFYSDATWLPSPVGSVAGEGRFIDLHQPDFVVVHPDLQHELTTAIAANPRAHLLFSKRDGKLLVYELLKLGSTSH
jgi:hypothetical protein